MSKGLDLLKSALANESTERSIGLPNGKSMVFYMTPLTLKERQRAKAMLPNKDKEDTILQSLALVVLKATDKDGLRLFDTGDFLELQKLPETTLLQLMEEVFKSDFDDEMMTTKAGESMEEKQKN